MLAGVFALVAGAGRPVAAMPELDPARHPVIGLVSTDRAVYAPGATGQVLVTVRGASSATPAARVTAAIYRDLTLVGTFSATVRRAPQARVVALPFTAPGGDERGYRVAVAVDDGHGGHDAAGGAIDVQTTALHARFPRQCWVSHWDDTAVVAGLLRAQVAWHCNTIQSYASYNRPELAPPPSLAAWRSLSNLVVRRAAIRAVVTAAHAANMPVGFFQATGEAYADWPTQVVRPALAWGSFRTRCGLQAACRAADLDRSPPAPDGWSRYGWRADHLDFFDPCNPAWANFLVTRSVAPMMAQFGFDFWQADTVGAPVQPTYDAAGQPLDTGRCLTALTAAAAAALGRPVVLNTVSGWASGDPARRPYLYRETWNYDTPFYPGLNGVVADLTRRGGAGLAIVQPAYINRALAEQCARGTRRDGCTVNPNAALLATAMFAAAGSTWMNHADQGCILTNVFVEGVHLPCSAALVDDLLTYKAFEVAYESLLRDRARDSSLPCAITVGGRGGAVGAAGEVYVLSKARLRTRICHLINLTGVASSDWTDLDGCKERPTPLGPLSLKLHYAGRAPYGRLALWSASPDVAGGAAQPLPYTLGSDVAGQYVAFTLPRLQYWAMIVLDTR